MKEIYQPILEAQNEQKGESSNLQKYKQALESQAEIIRSEENALGLPRGKSAENFKRLLKSGILGFSILAAGIGTAEAGGVKGKIGINIRNTHPVHEKYRGKSINYDDLLSRDAREEEKFYKYDPKHDIIIESGQKAINGLLLDYDIYTKPITGLRIMRIKLTKEYKKKYRVKGGSDYRYTTIL